MSKYAEKDQTRTRVVEYYLKVANRSKPQTVRHFKSVKKRTIYGILRRFEERGTIKRIKPPGQKPRPENVEKFRKYIELYKVDPQITLSEAAQILGMAKSTLSDHKNKLRELAKSNSSTATKADMPDNKHWAEIGNDYDKGHDASEDTVATSSTGNSSVKQESVPAKPRKKRTKAVSKEIDIQKRCLVCMESFQKRPSNEGKVMEKNMTMVFVLKKLLNLSSEDLIEMMKNSKGRCPRDWSDFCEKCHKLVEKAMDIHGQIRKLEKEMTEFMKDIVRSIKKSSGLRFKKICDKERLFLEKRVREVVIKKEITPQQSHPFDEGDEEAKSRVHQMGFQMKKEVVEPEIDTVEVDFDFHGGDTNTIFEPEPTVSTSSVPLKPSGIGSNDNDGNGVMIDVAGTPTLGVCEICGVQIRPLALPTHKLKEHGVVMEGYTIKKCTIENCKYETLYDSLYRAHRRKMHHQQTRCHTCHVCGKSFKHKQYLRIHEGIHKNAETRPYQCEMCGASFAVKNYLYLHTRLSHQGRYFPSTKRKRPKP